MGQKALLLLHQMSAAHGAYNVAVAVRLHEAVSEAPLRAAVARTVERHPLLRSVFRTEDGTPVRRLLPAVPDVFDVVDVERDDEEALRHAVAERAEAPFDIEHGAPLRVTLLRTHERDAVLLIVIHHIATDATSQFRVLDDILTAHRALADDSPVDFPRAAPDYDGHVREQTAFLASEEGEEALRYWRELCAGSPDRLHLPFDRPRPPVQDFHGAQEPLDIPAETQSRLHRLAHDTGIPVSVYLMSAYQVLLGRLSGQDDFMLGCTTTLRDSRTWRHAVGYFVNTLPLRARLTPGAAFSDVVGATLRQVHSLYKARHFPFALLPGALNIQPSPERSPLFQVTFNIMTVPRRDELVASLLTGAPIVHRGLRLSGYTVPQQHGQVDLCAEFLADSTTLSGFLKYRTSLFDAVTVRDMAAQFVRILEAVAAGPVGDLTVRRLLRPGDAERAALLALSTGPRR